MRRHGNRPFRISDAVVLIAATGFGLAGWRFWFWASRMKPGDLLPRGDLSVLFRLWVAAFWSIPLASIMLLSWTVAILLLRVVVDRPRRRRLWCQPGFLACFAVFFDFAWKCVGIGSLITTEIVTTGLGSFSRLDSRAVANELTFLLINDRMTPIHQANVGPGVLIAWLVTWAAGRCRPESSVSTSSSVASSAAASIDVSRLRLLWAADRALTATRRATL
jgi:hypothetical protein